METYCIKSVRFINMALTKSSITSKTPTPPRSSMGMVTLLRKRFLALIINSETKHVLRKRVGRRLKVNQPKKKVRQ